MARWLKGWTPVRNDLIVDQRLTATDKLVFIALVSHCWRVNGVRRTTAWPSGATLARMLGKCRRTVVASLQRLADLGYISVAHSPGHSNLYTVQLGLDEQVADEPVQKIAQVADEPVQLVSQTCAKNCTSPVQLVAHESDESKQIKETDEGCCTKKETSASASALPKPPKPKPIKDEPAVCLTPEQITEKLRAGRQMLEHIPEPRPKHRRFSDK